MYVSERWRRCKLHPSGEARRRERHDVSQLHCHHGGGNTFAGSFQGGIKVSPSKRVFRKRDILPEEKLQKNLRCSGVFISFFTCYQLQLHEHLMDVLNYLLLNAHTAPDAACPPASAPPPSLEGVVRGDGQLAPLEAADYNLAEIIVTLLNVSNIVKCRLVL